MQKPVNKALIAFLVLSNLSLFAYLIYDKLSVSKTSSLSSTPLETSTINPEFKVKAYDLPDSLDFAGELVPIQFPRIQKRFDAALIPTVYRHSSTILRYKRAARWFPEIEAILKKNNIPDDFKYMAIVESNLQNLISSQGATGFWQFMPETAREYGLEVNGQVDERYHPIKSTEAAVKYLADAYRIFKNWTLVAASYNMGMRGLQNRIKQQKVDSYYDLYLNAETSAYVYHILVVKSLFENPQRYGFYIAPEHLYKQNEFEKLNISQSIPSLVDFALEKNINYDILKTYNPWLRSSSLIINNAKSYTILIPTKP